MSFFYGRPAMASVVATEDSDVWEISRDVFKNFLEKYPNVKETAERIMKEREAINIQRLKFEPSESDNLDDDIRIIL
jgi:CRP-like cAMP-binding protein